MRWRSPADPATPAPSTSTFAGGTVPAAVMNIGKNFGSSSAPSSAARYPETVACDDRASIDCARLILGRRSRLYAVTLRSSEDLRRPPGLRRRLQEADEASIPPRASRPRRGSVAAPGRPPGHLRAYRLGSPADRRPALAYASSENRGRYIRHRPGSMVSIPLVRQAWRRRQGPSPLASRRGGISDGTASLTGEYRSTCRTPTTTSDPRALLHDADLDTGAALGLLPGCPGSPGSRRNAECAKRPLRSLPGLARGCSE